MQVETGSHYVVKAGLKLTSLLPQHPNSEDYRHVPQCPAAQETSLSAKLQAYEDCWLFRPSLTLAFMQPRAFLAFSLGPL